MKTFLVAGARPNFMKIAPVFREALKHSQLECKIIHTGQHYDFDMSQTFFEDLELPAPHFFLDGGSGSHAEQTAKIMTAFEKICITEKPNLVVVVGDVNSTLACSVVAKKLWIKVAHVEAGLRSFDMQMPEEINRMVTDSITDYFFVTEQSAVDNLLKEGKPRENIHFVGHVMIDNLLHQVHALSSCDPSSFRTHELKRQNNGYIFLTLHRPSNVDDKHTLSGIVEALNVIAAERAIFFPVHPRTQKMLEQFDLLLSENIFQLPPLGFKDSLFLWKDSILVLTDSGGLQEETTALGVPCITMRDNTERPITIAMGTNMLSGNKTDAILNAYRKCLAGNNRKSSIPPMWDGRASERIWKVLLDNQ
jgi:UDP-N-acetylglucosamine 2-epimerase (non-hydrolysing)